MCDQGIRVRQNDILMILLKNHYDNHTSTIRKTLKGVNLKAICKQCRECLDLCKTKGKYPLSCALCSNRPTGIRDGALTIAELREMKIARYSDESDSTMQSLLQAFLTCISFIVANYTDWLNEVKKLVEENASKMKDFFSRQPDEFFFRLPEELKSVVFDDESAKTSDAKSSSSNSVSALMLLVEGIALSFTIAVPSELEIMRKFALSS
ncbi:unnamed protein product [Hymenolepis diminuta]|uniref:Uncharacterized protein n=1 Tax=Hymenolepis diminuta TaxID=6216 RepID=A0A0R3SEY6_HYMDI|nr:unnamed protein product [Hymenolepis diminuta]